MAKLERLTISNFRGASNRLSLDFDKSKPITLIFGENGTGKSTIADALDAMGNASAGSLEDRSSVSARTDLPTIGKVSGDIHIELTAGGKTWTSSVGREGIPSATNPRPRIRVLRRTKFLAIVNDQPAKRYEHLKQFIDVQHVEAAESALKDAFTSSKRSFDLAVSQRSTAEIQLREVWEKEGSLAPGPAEWAESIASANAAALQAKAKSLRDASTAIQKAEQRLVELDSATQNAIARQGEAAKIEDEVAKLPAVDGNTAVALAGLLSNAASFLASGEHEDLCPVCEQRISIDQLKSDLQKRMADLSPFEAIRVKRDSAVRALHTARQTESSQGTQFLLAARPLLSLLANPDLAPITDLGLVPDIYPELGKMDNFDPDQALTQGRALVSLLAPIRTVLDHAAEEETSKAAKISSIETLHRSLERSIQDSESMQKIQAALGRALDFVRQARIAYTQSILNAVASECNRLYSTVHPDENVAITKLELDPGRRASLNQKADFEGHSNITPQAYFSESHLDTLAFCFWLALTKREFPNKDATLVLDDVFTSVDSQHIGRIAQLVVDESQHFAHVVVTTHQRIWRDIYRNPHGAGKRTQLIELQRWALSKGISSYKTKLAVLELADSLKAAPFERQTTASQAGILLESILDGLSLHYRCRVARTPDANYTLGELLDATASLFKKAEIHRPILDATGAPMSPPQFGSSKPEAIVEKLRSLAFIRNQVGAHFNASGAEISDRDVEVFAELTVQLTEALSCSACGQIPGKDASTHFECSCPSVIAARMVPPRL